MAYCGLYCVMHRLYPLPDGQGTPTGYDDPEVSFYDEAPETLSIINEGSGSKMVLVLGGPYYTIGEATTACENSANNDLCDPGSESPSIAPSDSPSIPASESPSPSPSPSPAPDCEIAIAGYDYVSETEFRVYVDNIGMDPVTITSIVPSNENDWGVSPSLPFVLGVGAVQVFTITSDSDIRFLTFFIISDCAPQIQGESPIS